MSIIEVRDLSKLYHLGQIGRASLIRSARYRWRKLRGASTDDLDSSDAHSDIDPERRGPDPNSFWAVKDVSFDVEEGEVLGIIGKNGAGKSTLLKILSRITEPTYGYAKMRGRVASLLEVGTGFHADLTGRENVYLNGTILGLKKPEIDSRLDEIVDFSGVEKFIDTPAKRYSSGMLVRLAFAVAAHLDPEILIIDEVLAVGDAEFQKRCLGKMKDVATNEGRTILFVSHQLNAVQNLCKKAILIDGGRIRYAGNTADALDHYLNVSKKIAISHLDWGPSDNGPTDGCLTLSSIGVSALSTSSSEMESTQLITMATPIRVTTEFHAEPSENQRHLTYHLINEFGVTVMTTWSSPCKFAAGSHRLSFVIPEHLLNSGSYSLRLLVVRNGNQVSSDFDSIVSFEVCPWHSGETAAYGREPGVIQPKLDWKHEAVYTK